MMHLTSRAALARLSDTELTRLHRQIFDELIRSDADTAERRLALAALETIEAEQGARISFEP